MKRTDRIPYFTLTEIELPTPRFFAKGEPNKWGTKWNIGLCHLCRNAEWQGSSACDDSNYVECHCGIEWFEDDAFEYCMGGDCWMFKPAYILEDCVDAVGLLLQGWWPDWGSLRLCYKQKVKEVSDAK